jgi:hypothetical protein
MHRRKMHGAVTSLKAEVKFNFEAMRGFALKALYAVFAESVWILVGAMVGFFGLYLGVYVAHVLGFRGSAGQALSFFPMLTVPAFSMVSGVSAAIQLLLAVPFEMRLKVMLGVNGAGFAVLFAYAFFSCMVT